MFKLKSIVLATVMAFSFTSTFLGLSNTLAAASDDFYAATEITNLPFTETTDTTGATTGPSDPSPCGYLPNNSVWYRFTPPTNMWVQADTSGSSHNTAFGAYMGDYGSLYEQGCAAYGGTLTLYLTAGTTYYFEIVAIGSGYPGPGQGLGGDLVFNLDQMGPSNDNFANALSVVGLPFTNSENNSYATTETGEPTPSCAWWEYNRTIWFAYTPNESQSVTANVSGLYPHFIAVYTGSALNSLTELGCRGYSDPLTIQVEPGTSYYFQVGSLYGWIYGDLTFSLDVTPPPTADFGWWPGDPNIFDQVNFCDSSYDPGGAGFSDFWWDFGDGSTTTGNCVSHQYAADGDYTVWHKVQTYDGRTAEVTKSIQVRTHDVAITKFVVPQSARAGQTRTITVGLRNTRYPETVTVELLKSSPWGYVHVASLTMYVPVRPSNRTTDFKFSYTFTAEDAQLGKVTFKATAYLQGRDALPADNEAIALPTKVTR